MLGKILFFLTHKSSTRNTSIWKMLILPFFTLFSGANSELDYSNYFDYDFNFTTIANQKEALPLDTLEPPVGVSDLQNVTVKCLNFDGIPSSKTEKFQIKIWWNDGQVNGWKTQLLKLQIIIKRFQKFYLFFTNCCFMAKLSKAIVRKYPFIPSLFQLVR